MSLPSAFLSELAHKLSSRSLSDVLDAQGLRCQALRGFKTLSTGILCGFARTALFRPVYHIAQSEMPSWDDTLLGTIKSGEIMVLASGSGSLEAALFDETTIERFTSAGAAGFLCDGYGRGSKALKNITDFPVLARGTSPLDPAGRAELAATDVPVELGGIRLQKGDFLFGDEDGIIIVPKALATQVIALAVEKEAARLNSHMVPKEPAQPKDSDPSPAEEAPQDVENIFVMEEVDFLEAARA